MKSKDKIKEATNLLQQVKVIVEDLFEKDLEDIAETAQDIKQLNYLIGHISFGFTSPLFKAEAYLENN